MRSEWEAGEGTTAIYLRPWDSVVPHLLPRCPEGSVEATPTLGRGWEKQVGPKQSGEVASLPSFSKSLGLV